MSTTLAPNAVKPRITKLGADAVKYCPDPTCPGSAPTPIGVELHVAYTTQRLGPDGPVTIAGSERRPIVVAEADRACTTCGRPNVIDGLQTTSPLGPDPVPRWPEPHVSPGDSADETLPAPDVPQPTTEQRLAELERRVVWLETRR